ncbi:hypothetical protein QZH41_017490, partial [Actinostola sp. cb2023]
MTQAKKTKHHLRALGTLKRRKKRRKDISGDSEELPKLNPSAVYIEDPSDLTQRGDAMTMDVIDFWHFIYGAFWRGRLRICEGELMQKLIACFDDLAQNKIIAKVITTRNFQMPTEPRSLSCSTQDGRHSSVLVDFEEEQLHVVKTSFSYYGGIPLKKHRKVSFASQPNSVFTPPIRHSLPIIKYTHCGKCANP